MIDEFGSAAAFGPVQIPVGIDGEEAMNLGRLRASLAFFAANELARVLDHLAAFGNPFQRKNTPAMNLAGAYLKTKSAMLRVNVRA